MDAPFSLRPRLRDAALVRSELERLSDWARRAWPEFWHSPDCPDDLGDAVSIFLSDGYDYSNTVTELRGQRGNVIARALLIGIGRSRSHEIRDIEIAIGVPLPPEARQ